MLFSLLSLSWIKADRVFGQEGEGGPCDLWGRVYDECGNRIPSAKIRIQITEPGNYQHYSFYVTCDVNGAFGPIGVAAYGTGSKIDIYLHYSSQDLTGELLWTGYVCPNLPLYGLTLEADRAASPFFEVHTWCNPPGVFCTYSHAAYNEYFWPVPVELCRDSNYVYLFPKPKYSAAQYRYKIYGTGSHYDSLYYDSGWIQYFNDSSECASVLIPDSIDITPVLATLPSNQPYINPYYNLEFMVGSCCDQRENVKDDVRIQLKNNLFNPVDLDFYWEHSASYQNAHPGSGPTSERETYAPVDSLLVGFGIPVINFSSSPNLTTVDSITIAVDIVDCTWGDSLSNAFTSTIAVTEMNLANGVNLNEDLVGNGYFIERAASGIELLRSDCFKVTLSAMSKCGENIDEFSFFRITPHCNYCRMGQDSNDPVKLFYDGYQYLHVLNNSESEVFVFDIGGKLLLKEKATNAIDVSGLIQGLYIVKLSNNSSKVEVLKFVK